jgi:glycosyltransferase involved in cell wall biosynthesis
LRETPHDAIYLNSFFHPRSTTLPLLAQRLGLAPRRPVIVAPRGEFSPGALDLKRRKKMAYIAFVKTLGLYRNVLWQASSTHEEDDIRAVFGARARVRIASDLPRAVHGGAGHVPRAPGQPLRVIFLSRISPMKNLMFALEVLAKVAVPVEFSVVGYIATPAYWSECSHLIATLPPHIHVRSHGSVPAPEVPKVLAQHDLFFLPTLGENFGHVIIEALGAGTPALISDRTPWQDFAADGCGWVEPLSTPEAYVEHIETLFAETSQEASLRRQAAIRYARRFTEESTIIDDNRRLFQSVSPKGIK